MIYLCGDTHGNINKISKILNIMTKKDILIVLGDFGFVWNNESNKNLDILEKTNIKILFVDGNHENFDMLKTYKTVKRYGNSVGLIRKNIFWLKRGNIYKIKGKSFLAIGGAFSVDKNYRIQNISWWSDEEINNAEITNTFENLVKYGNKVDYVLTHTCPKFLIDKMFGLDFKNDANSNFFNTLYTLIDFKHWYFGHFHEDIDYKNFSCLYENVKIIE